MPPGGIINERLYNLPCTRDQYGVSEEELQEQTVHVTVGTKGTEAVPTLLTGDKTLRERGWWVGGREGGRGFEQLNSLHQVNPYVYIFIEML